MLQKNLKLPVAKPKPAVHNGGIRAVAMATPGIGFHFSHSSYCNNTG